LARIPRSNASASPAIEHFVLVFSGVLGLCLLCFIGSFILSLQVNPTQLAKDEAAALLAVFRYLCVGIAGLLGGKSIK
jgi:hypothetical protein